jgi:uncharacterized protein (DUF302 family)
MNDALAPVEYGAAASSLARQSLVVSSYSFDETLLRLEQAIAAEGLWLIHAIDPQALLERAGYAIPPTRQLFFFHPRYMRQLLAIDPNAVIEVPLKLVVMQLPDGRVTLRQPRVDLLLAHYPGLTALGHELAAIGARLADAIAPLGRHAVVGR